MQRPIRATAGLLLIATAAQATPAQAFEFTPLVAQFAPQGAGTTRSFVVRNTQPGVVAIQIEVMKRGVAPDGAETRTPEENDFIVSPPQMVLPPGQSQNVRVQWLGEAAPARELSYRFIVRQVPISYQTQATQAGGASANVSMGYTYEAAIYVTPPKAAPVAKVVAAEPAAGADGAKLLRLTFASEGATRAILQRPSVVVTPKAGGPSVALDKAALKDLDTKNLLAGSVQTVDLPWPAQAPYGPVDVQFSTEYLVLK